MSNPSSSAATASEVQQEYFENQPTDIEAEPVDAEPQIDTPWKPEQIRVDTKSYSLRNILDYIDDKTLDLAPEFQRRRVWDSRRKSRLIESILLQIPLPAFYFAEDRDGGLRVVDGVQRLSTVYDFVRGELFKLTGLEYLTDEANKRFDELPVRWQRRIDNTQIVVNVIDPRTPLPVMYEIFRRINTGGVPLNPQEIRHCMSAERSRRFLRRCVDSREFRAATQDKQRDHIRMMDLELALRFCAFGVIGVDGYAEYHAMDAFLQEMTERLDDPDQVPGERLNLLYDQFGRAMNNCWTVFGEHAFRKWPQGVDGLNPVNRPLFESWSVALAGYAAEDLVARRAAIVSAARVAMTSDSEYLDSISTATGTPAKVRTRFRVAARIAKGSR